MAGLKRDQTSALGESEVEGVDTDRLDACTPQGIDDRGVQAGYSGMGVVDPGDVLSIETIVYPVAPGLGVPARPCAVDENECLSVLCDLVRDLAQAGMVDSASARFIGYNAPPQFQYNGLSHASLFSRRRCRWW